MTIKSTSRRRPRSSGFTLVELIVVLVIVALLSALTLAGLAGARDRAKADKTRSTIRKLHEIIVPQYESYLTRRVPQARLSPTVKCSAGQFIPDASLIASSTLPSANRLWGLRLLLTLEMPDQWSDVSPPNDTLVPAWAATAPVKRYAALKTAKNPTPAYESAECLAMIVTRGGFDADMVETFRADEVGDVDMDGCPEFLDGWGQPIGFIRWPAGFQSALQPQDASLNPDPFDPMMRSQRVAYPGTTDQTDYGVTPLIFSGGPDRALELPVTGSAGKTPYYGGYYVASDISSSASWVATFTGSPGTSLLSSGSVASTRSFVASGPIAPGAPQDLKAVRDNITNFDLLKK